MKIRIEIDTSNAAFREDDGRDTEDARDAETARILRRLANEIEAGGVYNGRLLYDINGNKAGFLSARED